VADTCVTCGRRLTPAPTDPRAALAVAAVALREASEREREAVEAFGAAPWEWERYEALRRAIVDAHYRERDAARCERWMREMEKAGDAI
jgi:hypothetical protein